MCQECSSLQFLSSCRKVCVSMQKNHLRKPKKQFSNRGMSAKNEATAVKANDGVDVNLRLLFSSGDVCVMLVQLAFYLVSNYQKSFEVAKATDLLPNDKSLCSTSFENSHRWLDQKKETQKKSGYLKCVGEIFDVSVGCMSFDRKSFDRESFDRKVI